MQGLRALVNEGTACFQAIISHQGMIACIRNQDPIIKTIFTHDNLLKLISYMVHEHAPESSQDNAGDLKLAASAHFSAMEILSSQCHHINNMLLLAPDPLIENLMGFLNQGEHYVLAAYFSKTIIAITKRVFHPSNKYNKVFCSYVFDQGYLMKTINHFYSESTSEYVIKWLSLKTYTANNLQSQPKKQQDISHVQLNAELTMPSTICDNNSLKKQFLLQVLTQINEHKMPQMSIRTAIQIFSNLLSQPQSQNQQEKKFPGMIQKKSTNVSTAFELYSLVCNQEVLYKLLEVGQMEVIGVGKLNLIKVLARKYREAELKRNEGICYRMLYQMVEIEMLEGVLDWLQMWIRSYFRQESPSAKNNSLLLCALELLEQLQSINSIKDNVIGYYCSSPGQSIATIVSTMKTHNNLVQLAQSRLIMFFLNELKCFQFGKRLLLQGILQIIDEQSVREHVVLWAESILGHFNQSSNQNQEHIFDNQEEETQWEHASELVAAAKDIQIGNYRLAPSNAYFCYSEEKARLVFGSFLSKKPVVVYNEKANPNKTNQLQEIPLKKVSSSPNPLGAKLTVKKNRSSEEQSQEHKQISIKEEEAQKEQSCADQIPRKTNLVPIQFPPESGDLFDSSTIRSGYLPFNVDELMADL